MIVTLNEWCHRWNVPQQALAELFVPPELTATDTGRSESNVVANVRLEAARRGVPLWRNNVGAAVDDTGRHIRYGLGNDSKRINDVFKSSDLIGIAPGGRFLAVECKAPNWVFRQSDERANAQARFIAAVQAAGGVGGFVRSREEFNALVR